MMDLCLIKNDLAINDGDFMLCSTDKEALAQIITIRLKTLFGEWFLDANRGIPYLEIFGHKRNDRVLEQLIREEIATISEVKGCTEFVFENDEQTRHLTIKFKILLSDHTEIIVNESMEL